MRGSESEIILGRKQTHVVGVTLSLIGMGDGIREAQCQKNKNDGVGEYHFIHLVSNQVNVGEQSNKRSAAGRRKWTTRARGALGNE